MVRLSWVVPEVVNRPIVTYEVERATSALDVYLEGACTIEELHYEKVDCRHTALALLVQIGSHLDSDLSCLQPVFTNSVPCDSRRWSTL